MRHKINRLWRLIGTGISFTMFGVGGLILGLLVFPMLFLAVRNSEQRQVLARRIISESFSAFIWLMKTLGVLSYEIIGDPGSAPKRNCLIVANHPTLIDVVFLIALFPQADCVIKSALWRNPFTRGAVSAANYISNDGGPEVLEHCISRLTAGSTLILFPEGTRTEPHSEPVFKVGAAAVAVRAASELQPVLILCCPLTLYKNDAWYNTPSRRPLFRLKIKPSRRVRDWAPIEAGQRKQQRALAIAMEGYFREELASFD